MQQKNKFGTFVARISWFLAVAVVIIATFTTAAQAQTAPSTEENWVDYLQTVTLQKRESFARVYAAVAEGVPVEAFGSCAREGTNCPTRRALEADPQHYTLRRIRALRTNPEIQTSPGEFARRLHHARALSARCLMDTTIGTTVEQEWVSVRFNPRTFDDHPWNLRRWFSHRCRAREITVRAGRPFAYAAYRRPAEIAVTNAAHQASGTTAQPPDLERLRVAANALLAGLSDSAPHDIPIPVLRAALRAVAKAATEVPLKVSVVEVPAPAPRANAFEEARYTKLQVFTGVLAVIAAMCALGLWGLHRYYRDVIRDMKKEFAAKFQALEEDSARVLAEAEKSAFARGRAEGVSATEGAFAAVANFLLSKIRATSLLQEHAGTVSERFDEVFQEWDAYLRTVENRGRTKAVSAVHASLAAAFARFNLTLTPVTDGDTTTLASLVTALFDKLQGKSEQKSLPVPHQETLDYTVSPMLKALQALTVEQLRDLIVLLGGIHASLPTDDVRRSMKSDDPTLILELLRFREEQLKAVERDRHEQEASVARAIQGIADDIQGIAIVLDPDLKENQPKRGVAEFGPEGVMRPLKEAIKFLWRSVYNTIGDSVRVDWANPPESIRALVEAVYMLLPPQERDPQITDYRERAGTATGLLNEFLARSLRFFTSIGSDVAYLRDKAEEGLRYPTLPETK